MLSPKYIPCFPVPKCAHNALNAILYNTGGERKDFMLILATNRADDLDAAAILDCYNESLNLPCPDKS
jgi:ATPase family AAA domain-containing protein 3A/B